MWRCAVSSQQVRPRAILSKLQSEQQQHICSFCFLLKPTIYIAHIHIYIYAANLGLAEAEMASVAERALNIQPPKIKLKARRLRGHEDSTNCCIASSQNPRIIVTSGEVTSIFKFSSLLFTFHLLYSIIIIITVVVS